MFVVSCRYGDVHNILHLLDSDSAAEESSAYETSKFQRQSHHWVRSNDVLQILHRGNSSFSVLVYFPLLKLAVAREKEEIVSTGFLSSLC